MRVLIVIVNYRTAALTVDCLRSLADQIGPTDARVVVTDNASGDGSADLIAAAVREHGWSAWVTLLPLPHNGGFAYGNNEGIRPFVSGDLSETPGRSRAQKNPRGAAAAIEAAATHPAHTAQTPHTTDVTQATDATDATDATRATGTTSAATSSGPGDETNRPQYVYLLNPDTIALPGAVSELVDFLDRHPAAGIAGGRAENADGTVRRSCFRFHSVLGEVESTLRFGPVSKVLKQKIVAPPTPDAPTQIDWVSGASMMVRRAVLEQIGGLDAGFFMYFEETDFCRRAVEAGWGVWYVPASRIIHLVGQSSGVTGTQRGLKRRPKYWFESRARYYRKAGGLMTQQAANALWLVNFPLSRLLQVMRGQKRTDPPKLWWDFVRYNYLGK